MPDMPPIPGVAGIAAWVGLGVLLMLAAGGAVAGPAD